MACDLRHFNPIISRSPLCCHNHAFIFSHLCIYQTQALSFDGKQYEGYIKGGPMGHLRVIASPRCGGSGLTGTSKVKWRTALSSVAGLLALTACSGVDEAFNRATDWGSSNRQQAEVKQPAPPPAQVSANSVDLYQRGAMPPDASPSDAKANRQDSGAGDGGQPPAYGANDPSQRVATYGVNQDAKGDARMPGAANGGAHGLQTANASVQQPQYGAPPPQYGAGQQGAGHAGGGPVAQPRNLNAGGQQAIYAGAVPPQPANPAQGSPAKRRDAAVPEKRYAKRSSLWDWTKIDLGRHTREETPVERLRRSRKMVARGQAPNYSQDYAIGLRGSETGGVSANPAEAQRLGASTGGPAGPIGPRAGTLGGNSTYVARSPVRVASQSPNPGIAATVPSRDKPMRIYFGPGISRLSSQTISSLASIAQTQKNMRRPVHVVGVAGSAGGEGPDFHNASALNELALSRAKAVAQELSLNGVAQGDIVVHAQQENRGSGASAGSARARRVDIFLDQ